jgi:hypothetical protein
VANGLRKLGKRWASALGAEPIASPAIFRAMIYDQAKPASQLAAFCRVVSVTALEFAEAAVEGFRSGRVVVPYAAMRCFIERTAHAAAITDAVKVRWTRN